MRCSKSGNLLCREMKLGQEELEQINRLTRREFQEEELYCFRVVLCDNEVDREWEQFDEQTLEELAGLFVGKTGICDHEAVSRNQQARIYEARVEREEGRTNLLGQPYCALVAKAYMVRTERNRDLILEIEAGIKKEVSVGCSVQGGRCSICGRERGQHGCEHIPGERYDGKLCCTVLHGAADAYEWSFVAVPAQRSAGVIKSLGERTGDSVEKLWQAAGRNQGLWLSCEEVCQLQGRMKNLMEDCEQTRRCARRQVMQEVFAKGEPDEAVNRSLSKMLDGMTVEQMKALRQMLCRSPQRLKASQFGWEEEKAGGQDSDKRFII